MGKRIKIDFKLRLVSAFLQASGNLFERKFTCAFYQDAFLLKRLYIEVTKKIVGVRIEFRFQSFNILEQNVITLQSIANSYKSIDFFLLNQFRHIAVNLILSATLKDIGKNQRFSFVLSLLQ